MFDQLTPHLWVTQSALFATNSGIFVSGDRALLIDPGIPPQRIAAIARFVADRGATPQAIVLTHGHWDHILGPEHFPGVPVIAQTRYLDVLEMHGIDLQRQVAAWETQHWVQRAQPFVPPRRPARHRLASGAQANFGGNRTSRPDALPGAGRLLVDGLWR